MRKTKSRLAAVGVVLGFALTATGCAGGSVAGEADASAGSTGSTNLKVVKLGIFPGATFSSLQLAVKKGIFTKHGIELKLDSGQGGAALLPAVSTGSLDFAVGNPVSVMTAASKGLDIKIVAGYGSQGSEKDASAQVVALPDSGIHSAKDLAGKTVAVNSLKGALELGIRESVELDGGDPNAVKFVEIGFPDMAAQLDKRSVDAACMGQPFMGPVLKSGAVAVVDSQRKSGTGGAALVTFASSQFANGNPELIKTFRAAWTEALDYASAHPDEMRAELPSFINMDPSLAKALPLEGLSPELDMGALTKYAQLMVKYGVVGTMPDLDKIVLD